jgi:PAS domain S-box-containing protein
MALKVKTKISAGLVVLFLLIIALSVVGGYSVKKLEGDVAFMLENNYEGISYAENMMKALDKLDYLLEDTLRTSVNAYKEQVHVIEVNLGKQQKREVSEKEKNLTREIRRTFEEYRYIMLNTPIKRLEAHRIELRMKEKLYALKDLQMNDLRKNNDIAQSDAKQGFNYITLLATLCIMFTIVFIFTFPEYIANPIKHLTESIKKIAEKSYEERIRETSNDEFGELAKAFNAMAEKLDDYEHSSVAKLTFEKNRIAAIINNMSDAIIGFDEDDTILFANKQAEELLGVDDQAIIGKNATDVARFNEIFRKLLLNRNNEDFTIKLFADGQENYFEQEVIDVHIEQLDAAPLSLGYVIILKNVTEFEKHDRETLDFVKAVTRKLQKPINAIQQQIKVLATEGSGELNAKEVDALDKIGGENEKLQKIKLELQSLQVKAEDEEENTTFVYQLTHPKEILQYACEIMDKQAEQAEIDIESHYVFDMPKVNVDLEKTAWVLLMFISNAIRYSPKKGKIIVKTEENAIENEIIFSVEDFGKGMTDEQKKKIFEKYLPSAQETKVQSKTGLAMAIAKEFIVTQGGKIWAESEESKGTIFYFSLPYGNF